MQTAFFFLATLLLLRLAAIHWGPGSHLEFASRVYRSRNRSLPGSTAELLRKQRKAWFYGNLAADIINFKGYGGHYNHCHRWTIVKEMQSQAEEPSEKAFCLGYLGHLAADTIAHNHFVPYHLARYARAKGLGHLYWEMRADRFVPDRCWKLVTELKSDDSLAGLDRLVNATVPKKILPMRANKMVFNHVLLVAERDRWRKGIDRLHAASMAPLEETFLESFRHAAVGRMRLALTQGGLEQLAQIDTNGKAAQTKAWNARKQVLHSFKGSKKRKLISEQQAQVFLEGMQSPPGIDPEAAPHW